MSYAKKSVVAVMGMLVMVIVFSRQLFLFMAFRDPQGFMDSPGGRYHLWLSLAAAVLASLAGALMFYYFSRHGNTDPSQSTYAPRESVIAVPIEYPIAEPPAPVPFDSRQWAQLNPWLAEGKSDDRRPMDGPVADSTGTPSGKRTFARESHQLKFKKWSQERRG